MNPGTLIESSKPMVSLVQMSLGESHEVKWPIDPKTVSTLFLEPMNDFCLESNHFWAIFYDTSEKKILLAMCEGMPSKFFERRGLHVLSTMIEVKTQKQGPVVLYFYERKV